jgi:hypothetical protein
MLIATITLAAIMLQLDDRRSTEVCQPVAAVRLISVEAMCKRGVFVSSVVVSRSYSTLYQSFINNNNTNNTNYNNNSDTGQYLPFNAMANAPEGSVGSYQPASSDASFGQYQGIAGSSADNSYQPLELSNGGW